MLLSLNHLSVESGLVQTAMCARHHSLSHQLCHWLLMSVDRLQSDELYMTQEMLAAMLGVRREGVTRAAQRLREAGLIHYRRGRIRILDRAQMETRSCGCYRIIRDAYTRLLPAAAAA